MGGASVKKCTGNLLLPCMSHTKSVITVVEVGQKLGTSFVKDFSLVADI